MFEETSEKIKKAKIIPVVKIDDVNKAVPLAKSLLEGGMTAVEITFRSA